MISDGSVTAGIWLRRRLLNDICFTGRLGALKPGRGTWAMQFTPEFPSALIASSSGIIAQRLQTVGVPLSG